MKTGGEKKDTYKKMHLQQKTKLHMYSTTKCVNVLSCQNEIEYDKKN